MEDVSEDSGCENEVSYLLVFKNRKVLIASFSCILATVFLLFSEPIISDHLIAIGVSEHYIGNFLSPLITLGYIFSAACLSYALAAPLVGFLVEHFSKEALTLFAFGLSSFALLI